MISHFKKFNKRRGFSLVETTTAMIILAMTCSSVVIVVNRNMEIATDMEMRMKAFEIARENMETLLASESVSEMTDFGTSEKYPNIQWQTSIEAFYEPITDRMWIQGMCIAEYEDSAGQEQTVELTHWLTDLTEKQLEQMVLQIQERTKLAELKAEEMAGADESPLEAEIDEDGSPTIDSDDSSEDGIIEPEKKKVVLPDNWRELPLSEIIKLLTESS